MLAACILALAVLGQGAETVREERADGTVVEREVEVAADGSVIAEGRHREWWPGGARKVDGRFRGGERHGKWREWHADGGEAVTGWYERGLRAREWTVRAADGSLVEAESGRFEVAELGQRGALRARGETRGGVRHGRWSFFWPHGGTQVVCAYREGVLAGPLLLVHADGTPDPSWASGFYEQDRRRRALSDAERAALEARIVPPAADPAGEVGALVEELRAEAGLPEPEREAGRELFELALDDAVLPEVVGALDLGRPDEARLANLIVRERVLPVYGVSFLWTEGERPTDLEAFALSPWSQRRWSTLLSYGREDVRLLELPLTANARPEGAGPFWLDDLHALPRDLHVRHPSALVAPRFERRRGDGVEAVERGLDWLVRHQDPDGGWSCAGFGERCRGATCDGAGEEVNDVGVTGLALLALMASGHTPSQGEHRAAVARGLAWLVEQQGPQGNLGPVLYTHGIATLALAEGTLFTDSLPLQEALERAVDLIEQARNPSSAWRYAVPPDGKNDTSVTTWMVMALTAAGQAGVEFDREALTGATSWYDQVSDPGTGRCGYDRIGSRSSRVERINDHYPTEQGEAMTAAALLGRYLIGQRPESVEVMSKHAELIATTLPEWDPDGFGCDLYYWFYGSQACHQLGGAGWKRWSRALDAALFDSQHADENEPGDAVGSWDPVGPWGWAGGRVYSTSLAVLALSAEWRHARLEELEGD